MNARLNEFLHYLQVEKGFSSSTVEAYRLDLEKGLIPFLHQRGIQCLQGVSKQVIRAYLDYLATIRHNLSAARARKLAVIKSFFNYLIEIDELEMNPAASIKGPKIPQKEPVYLNDDESTRLVHTVMRRAKPQTHERDVAIIVLFLHTGLRVSELVNLKVVDVDLVVPQIKITRKGGQEQYIHLNNEALKALGNYLNNRPQIHDGRLFLGSNGGDLNRLRIYEMVRKYLKLAGICKCKKGPHILRHTFCTRLHQKGVDPFTIKELAGHKNINTTMKYVRIENREQIEALDRLEFGFFDAQRNQATTLLTKAGGIVTHHLPIPRMAKPELK